MTFKLYQKEFFLVLLFALFNSAIYHFPQLWWIASFSLVPLFLCLEGLKSGKEAFWFGYLAGALFFALTLFWVVHVTLLGFIVIFLYLGLFNAAFSLASYKPIVILSQTGSPHIRHGWIKIFTVAGLWTLAEYLRSMVPVLKFPWALFGYSQWKNIVFIQSADLFGVYGVSFILVVFNLCVYALIGIARRLFRYELSFVNCLKQTLVVLCILAGIVGGNLQYGYRALDRLAARSTATNTVQPGPSIAVVQGNIPQHDKWNDRIKDMIFQKYEGLTRQAGLEKPELVIWPETAFPGYWEVEPEMTKRFHQLVTDIRTRVLIGAPTLRLDSSGQEKRMNTAMYFASNGSEIGRYHKLRLVPFGEYVPFFGIIRRYFEIGRFSPGEALVIFELPRPSKNPVRFSVLICFEDSFPDLCREAVNRGSRMLINITNDAWFKKTTAPYQHAQCSVFRAVENRVPVVRAANTGLSCFIDPSGIIQHTVRKGGEEIFVTGYSVWTASTAEEMTLYRVWGDAFVVLCLFLCMITYPIYLKRINRHLQPDSSHVE